MSAFRLQLNTLNRKHLNTLVSSFPALSAWPWLRAQPLTDF
jgi:hypothetical protein